MSGWLDNQKKANGNFRKLLQKRIDQANPRRKLTTDEAKCLLHDQTCSDIFVGLLWYFSIAFSLTH